VIVFEHRTLLCLLPLALLPWLPSARAAQAHYPALLMIAPDALSRWAGRLLRGCASVAIASLVIALAAPRARPKRRWRRSVVARRSWCCWTAA